MGNGLKNSEAFYAVVTIILMTIILAVTLYVPHNFLHGLIA